MEPVDAVVLGAVLLASALAVVAVHRCWPYAQREEHTDVAGFIYAGVAVLYAVLLAFVVILGWESLSSARATTYTEADQLSNVYWLSHGMPAPQGPAIEHTALAYARTVTVTEWPMMDKQGTASARAQDLMDQLRHQVFAVTPRTRQQQVLYEQAVASVNALTGDRRDRLDAMSDTVPEPIWATLIVGGFVMTAFCLLFGLENTSVHIVAVVGVAALVTISLLLVKNMQHPFAGDPHIGPGAFEVFLGTLHD